MNETILKKKKIESKILNDCVDFERKKNKQLEMTKLSLMET